jgi:hypothetical protein
MADKLLSQLLRNTYDNATPYTIGDIVDYQGSSYACKANTTGNLPTNTTYWAMLAEKGEQGIQGIQGIQGVKGDIGITWQGAWSAGTYQINDGVSHNGSSWIATAITTEEPSLSATDWDVVALKGTDGVGTGDVSSNTATSVDSEVTIFSGTGGKTIKRATGTGVAKLTSGVLSVSNIDLTSEVSNRLPFANLAQGTAHSVVGRAGSGSGDVGNISASNDTILGRSGSGDVAFNNASTTKTILALQNVDNTSDATKNSATATLTNKRITKRVQAVTSAGTVTASLDNDDMVVITAQAAGLTLANPTGTGTQGQSLVYRIKDNGTARTIGYGANFRAIGVTLPTTTVINKTIYLGGFWNTTDSRLDIVAVAQES